jgi:RNA polymerase sigma-70 factor (ECF subfamily)
MDTEAQRFEAKRFETMVLPHLDAAYRLARWLARTEADAEDLVQEAYARAWRFFGTLRGEDAKPWLMQILRNLWRSELRTRMARPEEVGLDLAGPEVERALAAGEDPPPDAEAIVLRLEDQALIQKAMRELPEAFREVLVLREVEDMAYRDIARVIEAPIGTVMSRLARARGLLGDHVRRMQKEAADGPR